MQNYNKSQSGQVKTSPAPATNILSMLPPVELPQDGQYISKFALDLGAILHNEDFFRRFDKCVVPKRDEQGKITLVEVKPAEFRTLIEQYCQPWQWRKTKRGTSYKALRTL